MEEAERGFRSRRAKLEVWRVRVVLRGRRKAGDDPTATAVTGSSSVCIVEEEFLRKGVESGAERGETASKKVYKRGIGIVVL